PWLFKVDSLGCLEPGCHLVNVEEITIGLENTLSAYPNPTSGLANITFALPPGFRDTQTELIVVDLTGREVHREALSAFALTSGTIQIDLSNQPAGIYLAQWVSGNTWLDSVKIVRD
ncbi:MAG: T9SS type A sorting domain-containing protein, partial [Cryomorphaceae bacterium]|nr:T9SS type A sorting domain-containing protein [Cryomorphaceae bacterium]